jgi:hypothetical protein
VTRRLSGLPTIAAGTDANAADLTLVTNKQAYYMDKPARRRPDMSSPHRRCFISGMLRPVCCQISDTTGMLISGEMSSGMITMADTPGNTMNAART